VIRREITPADEIVDVERVGLLEDGHGEASVQEQRLDKHPGGVGDHRVVDDRCQSLTHPVLHPTTHRRTIRAKQLTAEFTARSRK